MMGENYSYLAGDGAAEYNLAGASSKSHLVWAAHFEVNAEGIISARVDVPDPFLQTTYRRRYSFATKLTP